MLLTYFRHCRYFHGGDIGGWLFEVSGRIWSRGTYCISVVIFGDIFLQVQKLWFYPKWEPLLYQPGLFDYNGSDVQKTIPKPILNLLKRLTALPVVHCRIINEYLSTNELEDTHFQRVSPAPIQSLLKTSRSETAFQEVSEMDLSEILDYIVTDSQVTDLEGCTMLRNGRGEMRKKKKKKKMSGEVSTIY